MRQHLPAPAASIHQRIVTYATGFILSVLLTLAAYFSVTEQLLSGFALTLAIVGLAVAQLLTQIVFFLHLGEEKRPRLNLMALSLTVLIIGILVIGTLWVMRNLNTHTTPQHMEQYMSQHEGL